MHRDEEITQEAWESICSGLDQIAQNKLANWVAHGMKATKETNGIRLERSDYEADGDYLFISDSGQETRRKLDA